jgi:hypothetical protein
MDVQAFIVEIVNEYLANNYYYDSIVDLFDVTLDDYVTNNSIEVNKKIIDTYATDVFNALNLYEKYLGSVEDLHRSTREYFYQQLAYVTLFVEIYPQIVKSVQSPPSSEYEFEFSFDDVNGDIAELLSDEIDMYNSCYELGVAV